MKISCPVCDSLLPASQCNVATDVAVCQDCGEAFSISAALAGGCGDEEFDLSQAPRGAWFEDLGDGWQLGASTRSPIAFFLVPFMCVWSGFSLGGIYGSQVAQGRFNLGLSLFGIPFVVGTLLFGSIALMSVCGKIVVSTQRGEGRIFAGVGSFGWTRRFDWGSISAVDEEFLGWGHSGSSGIVIALTGKQSRVRFGSMLTEPRRYYLLQALRKLRTYIGKA